MCSRNSVVIEAGGGGCRLIYSRLNVDVPALELTIRN